MMSRLKVWCLVGLFAAFVLVSPAYADNVPPLYGVTDSTSGLPQDGTGQLTVTVRDTVGRLAAGVKVSLGPDIVRYTDGNGEVVFTQLASGTFTVKATVSSSLTASAPVTLMNGQSEQVSLKLAVIPPSPVIGYVAIGLIVLPLIVGQVKRQLDKHMVVTRWDEDHHSAKGIVVGTEEGMQVGSDDAMTPSSPRMPPPTAQPESSPIQQLTPIDPTSLPAASTPPSNQPPARR